MEPPASDTPHDRWTPHDAARTYQGYAPPPHQTPPTAQGATAQAPTNVFAILSLVAGILGLVGVLPFVGSIIAIVFAMIARNELKKDPHQRGDGFATAGLVLGIIGLVLTIIVGALFAFLSFFFGGFGPWGPWWWARW